MTKALQAFFDGGDRAAWLTVNGIDVFMRKSYRIFNGQPYEKVVDIANVEIKVERFRGQLRFSQLVADLTVLGNNRGYQALYIENVLTERFARYFVSRGWFRTSGDATLGKGFNGPPSFYKLLEAGKPVMTAAQMQLIADLALELIEFTRHANGTCMPTSTAIDNAARITLKIAAGLGVTLNLPYASNMTLRERINALRFAKTV
jgi:hypothetical protein